MLFFKKMRVKVKKWVAENLSKARYHGAYVVAVLI